MLMAVREELISRIDQTRTHLTDRVDLISSALHERIEQRSTEIKGEVRQLRSGISCIQEDVQGMKANVARTACLVEEQNARNKIVFDGLALLLGRQDRVEQRLNVVEATVRDLAAARPAVTKAR